MASTLTLALCDPWVTPGRLGDPLRKSQSLWSLRPCWRNCHPLATQMAPSKPKCSSTSVTPPQSSTLAISRSYHPVSRVVQNSCHIRRTCCGWIGGSCCATLDLLTPISLRSPDIPNCNRISENQKVYSSSVCAWTHQRTTIDCLVPPLVRTSLLIPTVAGMVQIPDPGSEKILSQGTSIFHPWAVESELETPASTGSKTTCTNPQWVGLAYCLP